jgi:hypothetical protein
MYYLRVAILAAVVGLVLVEAGEGFGRRRCRRLTQEWVVVMETPKITGKDSILSILCPSDAHSNLPPSLTMDTCVTYDSLPWGIIIDPTNPCTVTAQASSTLFSTNLYQIEFDTHSLGGRGYILRVGNYDASNRQTKDASFNIIMDAQNCDCNSPDKFKKLKPINLPKATKYAEIVVDAWPPIVVGKDLKVSGTIYEKGTKKKLATSIYGIAILKTKTGSVRSGTTTKQGPDFEITFDGLDPHHQLIIQVVNGTGIVRKQY